MKQSKYKNKKVEVDGIKFDSKVESEYYILLKKMVSDGTIEDFSMQPKYLILEKFSHFKYGSIRPVFYKADFCVKFFSGREIVVDIKGLPTQTALLKRKLFLNKYPKLDLRWISKSIKYGENGWIDYFDLEKIRRENRKKKGK